MACGNGSDTSPMTEVRDHWIPPQGPTLGVTGLRPSHFDRSRRRSMRQVTTEAQACCRAQCRAGTIDDGTCIACAVPPPGTGTRTLQCNSKRWKSTGHLKEELAAAPIAVEEQCKAHWLQVGDTWEDYRRGNMGASSYRPH